MPSPAVGKTQETRDPSQSSSDEEAGAPAAPRRTAVDALQQARMPPAGSEQTEYAAVAGHVERNSEWNPECLSRPPTTASDGDVLPRFGIDKPLPGEDANLSSLSDNDDMDTRRDSDRVKLV